ncbi:dirigent protein 24-like [Telopea speciosissima]|uniref:dirigent protein 24-like n=1 Tax=Telopea speciosissima TaxID=54955 RepID=UPI001CC3978C|nr:dirigent protein 24-like [Telopea speciosissima]
MTRCTSKKNPPLLNLNLMARFLMAITIFNQSTSSARILADLSPNRQSPYGRQRLMTFFMRSVLCDAQPPSTPNLNDQLPFPNPVGIFPPSTSPRESGSGSGSEYPVPESYPNPPTETPYMSGMQSSLSFPTVATATLQGLDLGAVTPIEEELVEGLEIGFPYIYLGRAKGAYVASSDDGSSHMMAMTAKFADGEEGGGGGASKDSLSFFGVHRTDVYESHISVIGGSGKYEGANGYATVKAVTMGSKNDSTSATAASATATLLQFTVSITY